MRPKSKRRYRRSPARRGTTRARGAVGRDGTTAPIDAKLKLAGTILAAIAAGDGTKPPGSSGRGTADVVRPRLTRDEIRILIALLDQVLPYPEDASGLWYNLDPDVRRSLWPIRRLRQKLQDPTPGGKSYQATHWQWR